jgi:predicted DNA-binding transcriptional regulator AlpA
MKIALDPYMLRGVPLIELPGVVAALGYEYIELSRATIWRLVSDEEQASTRQDSD